MKALRKLPQRECLKLCDDLRRLVPRWLPEEDRDDLVQEAFVAGLKARGFDEDRSSPGAYLTGILRRQVGKYLEWCRERRRPQQLATWDVVEGALDQFDPGDLDSIEDIVAERLRSMVGRLSDNDLNLLIVWVKFDTINERAAELGISRAAAYQRLCRLVKRLKIGNGRENSRAVTAHSETQSR